MEFRTLDQVADEYERLANERGELPVLRERITQLIQRAGDIVVDPENEPAKIGIVEVLRWTIEQIDAGMVQQ